MAFDPDNFDPRLTLEEYAGHLNSIRRPKWFGGPYYEIFSGALVWTDETRHLFGRTPVQVIWALRGLWAYRTSLMLGQPREELAWYWELGLERFPLWVGFRPERRDPTPALLEIYRRGQVRLRKCLRDMDRESEREARGG